jgi:hypothetical protein
MIGKRVIAAFALVAMLGMFAGAAAQSAGETEIVKPKNYKPPVISASKELQAVIDRIVGETLEEFADRGLKADEFSITLIDVRDPSDLKFGEHRGDIAMYPASVVKMFYLAALHQQMEDGKVTLTPELERGLRDMIVTSSNEATQYIVDVLTDTASGGELPQKEFELWSYRRNRMNRYFASMGYAGINVNQKTHCEDAYGVEQQFRNYKGENRLMIFTNASARLIAEIALGRMVTPERSRAMMSLLKREPFAEGTAANSQATDFVGKAIIDLGMKDAGLWSKAGWTSRNRHDAAYVETPEGGKFAIAIYTQNRSNDRDLIPAIARKLLEGIKKE